MIPPRKAVHGLAAAQEQHVFPIHDLANDRNGHGGTGGQRAHDRLRRGKEQLVVLPAGGREMLGITTQGKYVLAGVAGDGQPFEVYAASHAARLANVAHVGRDPVGEIYRGAHPEPGRQETRLDPRLRAQVFADEPRAAGVSVLLRQLSRRGGAVLAG